jgi:hypothetical protein
MRKTILTVLGATLVAATTIQMAAASEHRARKAFRAPAPASQQFRNAEDSVAWSAQPGRYSGYSGGFSAPAGR